MAEPAPGTRELAPAGLSNGWRSTRSGCHADPRASFITGQSLHVDGGWILR